MSSCERLDTVPGAEGEVEAVFLTQGRWLGNVPLAKTRSNRGEKVFLEGR